MAHWSIPFDKLAKKTKTDIETVVRESTFIIFTQVVIRSPVDTGRFRANWNVSYNTINTATTQDVQPDFNLKLDEVQKALLQMPIGGMYWLANSLPYAKVLEYGLYPNPPIAGADKTKNGYSKQAPHGMVRVAAREFSDAVNRAVAKRK